MERAHTLTRQAHLLLGLLAAHLATTTTPTRIEALIDRAYARWRRRCGHLARLALAVRLDAIVERASVYDRLVDVSLEDLRRAKLVAKTKRLAVGGPTEHERAGQHARAAAAERAMWHLDSLIQRRENEARAAAQDRAITPVRFVVQAGGKSRTQGGRRRAS